MRSHFSFCLAVLLSATPALAETKPETPAAGAAASAASPAPVARPSAATADPLAPKPEATPAPAAPAGMATATPQAQPAIVLHPTVKALLDRLGTGPAGDRETLATFYAARGQPLWTAPEGLNPRALSALEAFAAAADWGLDSPTAYRVPAAPAAFADANAAADYEIALSRAALAYAYHARGGRLDPAKVSALIDMKPRPYEPVSVLEALAGTEDAAAKLQSFHPRHAEFHNLQKAYAAARASKQPADKLARLEVNLERWRWMPDELGAFHIRNNVPEQLTRVTKDSKLIHIEKIVVGKPGHSTPVMSADMLFVIFHPSWGVPNGIKTNEVAPMLKRASARNASLFSFGESGGRASAALARHELRAYQNGREVNPDQIDWRTVDIRQFHFTQAPSAKNVLGVVKFRFPNKYDVYMHDTQEKFLFSHAVRAYSHGCMRVQNPLKLAELILANDRGWSMAQVEGAVKAGRSSDITLKTPVPVHLTYFTASADDQGKITYHGDIYGMDTRVASALAGKPVALAGASVSVQGPPPRAPRVASGGLERPSWSPFNGLSAN